MRQGAARRERIVATADAKQASRPFPPLPRLPTPPLPPPQPKHGRSVMFTISVNPPKPRVEAYAMSGPLRVAVPRAPLRPSPSPPPHSPSSSPAPSLPPPRAQRPHARPPNRGFRVGRPHARHLVCGCGTIAYTHGTVHRAELSTGLCCSAAHSSDATPIPTRSPRCRHPRHPCTSHAPRSAPPFPGRTPHPSRALAGARLRTSPASHHPSCRPRAQGQRRRHTARAHVMSWQWPCTLRSAAPAELR